MKSNHFWIIYHTIVSGTLEVVFLVRFDCLERTVNYINSFMKLGKAWRFSSN